MRTRAFGRWQCGGCEKEFGVWLCTDAAAKVTGRQFCVSGNRTTLLSWQYDVLAERDSSDEPWTVEAIGEQIEASMDSWPKLLKPMEV